jgi:hypothetical protein
MSLDPELIEKFSHGISGTPLERLISRYALAVDKHEKTVPDTMLADNETVIGVLDQNEKNLYCACETIQAEMQLFIEVTMMKIDHARHEHDRIDIFKKANKFLMDLNDQAGLLSDLMWYCIGERLQASSEIGVRAGYRVVVLAPTTKKTTNTSTSALDEVAQILANLKKQKRNIASSPTESIN